MNRLWAIAFALMLLVPCVHAQQDADERYVTIYNLIQQGDTLADGGQLQEALSTYTDAKSKLTGFQRLFPNWDQGIISYRMGDLNKKIAALQTQLVPKKVQRPAEPTAPVLSPEEIQAQTQASELQVELQTAKLENQQLQAKLKEALATQPAAVDATELAAAQQQLRDLMKQNELLKAGEGKTEKVVVTVEDTNRVSKLNAQLAESARKYSAEHDRAQQLMQENTALQRNLAGSAPNSSGLAVLQSENERLKDQLQTLQIAAENAAAAGELARKLNDARTQIANLQAASALAALEKAALENKVRKLSAQLADSAANFDSRIKDLSDQRDELLKKLDAANAKNSTRKVSDAAAQIAELNKEVGSLRARVEVDESKPVAYSADELALFRQSQPGVSPLEHSIKEMPAGTAELVVSAQKHFSNHEFTDAEADYQKILDRDQNNGLALANLATIELQEGKLADAEKHITAAVAQSPNDAYNLTTLGFLKFREEKYDDALDVLSRAAKIDPNNPEIQNYLGVTLSHKGQRTQAETALRKAIQIDGNYAPAHNNLAVIYLSQNPSLPQLARWHYQKALDAGQPRNEDLEKMLADKGAPVGRDAPAQ